MRDSTERPEGVEAGTARLVGTSPAAIVDAVQSLVRDQSAYRAMARAINPYGDGRAAKRAVAAMSSYFKLALAPQPFDPWAGMEPRAVNGAA
jgi:UDP-N-acetylglucosamine 2-epimerase (non-hydrolysing)